MNSNLNTCQLPTAAGGKSAKCETNRIKDSVCPYLVPFIISGNFLVKYQLFTIEGKGSIVYTQHLYFPNIRAIKILTFNKLYLLMQIRGLIKKPPKTV